MPHFGVGDHQSPPHLPISPGTWLAPASRAVAGTCNVGSPSFCSFTSDLSENQTTGKCRQWPKCAKTLQILPCSCPPGLLRSNVSNTRASQQAQHLAHPRLSGGQKDLPQHPQKLTSKVSAAGPQAAPRSCRGWHHTNTKRENGSCSAEAVAKIKQIRNKNEKGEKWNVLTNSKQVLGKAKYRTQGFKLCCIDHVIFPIFSCW